MKIKILKKLLAVLCAATMSASVVAPAGAVKYSGGNTQSATQKTNLNNLNKTIENSLNLLKQMDQKVSNKHSQNDIDKAIAKSLITNIQDILNRLDKLSVYSRTAIDNAFENVNLNSFKLFKLSNSISNKNFNDINNSLTNLQDQYTNILEDAKKFANNNNNNNHNNNNNNNMINNNNFNNMGIMNNNMFVNNNNMIDNEDKMVVNKIRNNVLGMRNRMITKDIDPTRVNLRIKLDNKQAELDRKLIEAYKFAEHRDLDPTYIQKIQKQAHDACFKILDDADKNVNNINQTITLLDNCIKALNKFTLYNNLTIVIPGTTSALIRTVNDKYAECWRLIDCVRKRDASFTKNAQIKQAFDFCNSINVNNPNGLDAKLKQAIKYLDIAIFSIKKFDDGTDNRLRQWQTEASKDIDMLLNQATKEMKNSPNKTSVQGIIKEFEPILCGKQADGNCWLYATCNVINFFRHIQNQPIIKNTGVQDVNGFDKVEKYFSQPLFNFSPAKLTHEGGTTEDMCMTLFREGIKQSRVDISYEKRNYQDIETSTKIVKTLLLKHFANSINPVLINVKYDECDYDVSFTHAMVVVGLDIDKNSVVVADSNFKYLQIYSLDRVAHAICNKGSNCSYTRNISLIFPSFTRTGNIHYDNNSDKNSCHSWSEFKSQLLPAISKQF